MIVQEIIPPAPFSLLATLMKWKELVLSPYIVTGTLAFVISAHYFSDFILEKSYRRGFYPLPVEIVGVVIFLWIIFHAMKADSGEKLEKVLQWVIVILNYGVCIVGMIDIFYRFY